MLEDKFIEPSNSPWAANICLVKKKRWHTKILYRFSKIKFCNTKRCLYPLPRIDETLDTLSGQAWFCTLDLASGYWQIKMHEKDKAKTAFTSHRGLFQFERLMDSIFRNLSLKKCLCYLDDVIVFGKDFDTTLKI